MPKYIVQVTEIIASPEANSTGELTQEVFKLSVDTIDLERIFAAATYKKRERKPRVQKGATP